MEITSLPTESLYKFEAFAGLVILFGTLTYAYKFIAAVSANLINAKSEVEIYKCKHEDWVDEIEYDTERMTKVKQERTDIEKQVESLESRIHSSLTPDQLQSLSDDLKVLKQYYSDSIARGKASETEIKEKLKVYRSGRLELDIIGIKMSEKKQLVNLEEKQRIFLIIACGFSVTTSIIIAYHGFSKWQEMQVYIDKSIIREATKK